jgi:hypothetical protein
VFTSVGVFMLREEDEMYEIADLLNDMTDELDRVTDNKGGVSEMLGDKWQRRFTLGAAHRACKKVI